MLAGRRSSYGHPRYSFSQLLKASRHSAIAASDQLAGSESTANAATKWSKTMRYALRICEPVKKCPAPSQGGTRPSPTGVRGGFGSSAAPFTNMNSTRSGIPPQLKRPVVDGARRHLWRRLRMLAARCTTERESIYLLVCGAVRDYGHEIWFTLG